MVTIADVAKLANVSTATVSRVLNESGYVRADTREAIMHAIKVLDYQPNRSRRSAYPQSSNMLLVLIPDFTNPFYGNILYGMDQEARLHGYSLLQIATYTDLQREREALQLLDSREVDGAIFLAPCLPPKELQQVNNRHKIIQCCEYLPEAKDVAHISIDYYNAAYEAVQYLIHAGHRRIAMFSAANSFFSTRERERAYFDALNAQNIPIDERLIIRENYSFDSGMLSAHRILSTMDELPTALMAFSDIVAAGAIRCFLDEGISIPEDIAVIGFDNIDLARMVTPPLSTVSQPLTNLGMMSVRLLINKIQDQPIHLETFLPSELILRKSTLSYRR